MAAPLTCTDLLAVDRVPGTRSTVNCTSFGFTSVTFTSLKPTQREDNGKLNIADDSKVRHNRNS